MLAHLSYLRQILKQQIKLMKYASFSFLIPPCISLCMKNSILILNYFIFVLNYIKFVKYILVFFSVRFCLTYLFSRINIIKLNKYVKQNLTLKKTKIYLTNLI